MGLMIVLAPTCIGCFLEDIPGSEFFRFTVVKPSLVSLFGSTSMVAPAQRLSQRETGGRIG